jgi:hypothetical protein
MRVQRLAALGIRRGSASRLCSWPPLGINADSKPGAPAVFIRLFPSAGSIFLAGASRGSALRRGLAIRARRGRVILVLSELFSAAPLCILLLHECGPCRNGFGCPARNSANGSMPQKSPPPLHSRTTASPQRRFGPTGQILFSRPEPANTMPEAPVQGSTFGKRSLNGAECRMLRVQDKKVTLSGNR